MIDMKKRHRSPGQYSLRITYHNVTTEQSNEGAQSVWGIVRSVSSATMAGRICHSVGFVTMRLIIGVLMCVLVLNTDVLSFD